MLDVIDCDGSQWVRKLARALDKSPPLLGPIPETLKFKLKINSKIKKINDEIKLPMS